MTRVSGIAGAFVMTLALAPISADAQQIFACVNNSGAIRIVAPDAVCPTPESLVTWNVGGPQGPPGPAGPRLAQPDPADVLRPSDPQGPAGPRLAQPDPADVLRPQGPAGPAGAQGSAGQQGTLRRVEGSGDAIACNEGEVLVLAICKEGAATLQGTAAAKCGTATGVVGLCKQK